MIIFHFWVFFFSSPCLPTFSPFLLEHFSSFTVYTLIKRKEQKKRNNNKNKMELVNPSSVSGILLKCMLFPVAWSVFKKGFWWEEGKKFQSPNPPFKCWENSLSPFCSRLKYYHASWQNLYFFVAVVDFIVFFGGRNSVRGQTFQETCDDIIYFPQMTFLPLLYPLTTSVIIYPPFDATPTAIILSPGLFT